MQKLIYIDTETTGLNHRICEIWQLAALIEIDGDIKDELNLLMAPSAEATIEVGALKLQDKSEEDLYKLPERYSQFEAFKDFLNRYVSPFKKTDKFLIVGYNVQFDINFLRSMWKSFGDNYFGSYFLVPALDVMGLMGYYAVKMGLQFKNFKLATICEALGIELDAHDAMSDIKATRILFKTIINTIRE